VLRTRLLGAAFDTRRPFQIDLIEGLYEAATAAGYELVLSAQVPGRSEEEAIATLLGYRCDAAILLSSGWPAERLEELDSRVPVVLIGRRVPKTNLDVVRTSEAAGMRLALGHLAQLGHREVLHIDGGSGQIPSDRRRAFRGAARALGLAARVQRGDRTAEAGWEAAHRLLAAGDIPTAIIPYHDMAATALIDAFTRAGVRIPDDVSVIGYDNSQLSQMSHVNLTSVGQDVHHLATQAVGKAVQRVEDRNLPAGGEVVLSPSLIVRGTTGPVRSGSIAPKPGRSVP